MASVRDRLSLIECPDIERITFNIAQLSSDYVTRKTESLPSKARHGDAPRDYVYILNVVRRNSTLVHELTQRRESADRTAWAFSRVIPAHASSHCLYVGRSKDLQVRLTQHFGATSRSVSALHLQHLTAGLAGRVVVLYMRFDNEDDIVVQAIEDAIWATARPAFGRRGKR
jgi:hypothetical protein